jgi:hypothetical protein
MISECGSGLHLLLCERRLYFSPRPLSINIYMQKQSKSFPFDVCRWRNLSPGSSAAGSRLERLDSSE